MAAPIPMRLTCPSPGCGLLHVDQGEFATKPHHTHACQGCGYVWRPAVVATVGVRFLPGFKDPTPATDNRLIATGEAVPPPSTAAGAASLLRTVAEARRQYLHDDGDRDLRWSIDMLDAAADLIETGEVWPWVPSWTYPTFRDQREPGPTFEEYEDLLGCVWLYINWRYVTKQLTMRQKGIFADAVDAWSARLEVDKDPVADRWWTP